MYACTAAGPEGQDGRVFAVTAIDNPALPEVLAELAAARAGEMDADTVNRELSVARKAIGWCQRQGRIAALWRLDVGLREKTFWKMLYESAPAPTRCCA
ncbi:hypothetical protein ACGFZZ_07130 [Streptomyces tendae]|uniref:hypothetical protein n=1 Tax=Streptomyces tendae TaxID=1932 RepID=UPI0033E522CB